MEQSYATVALCIFCSLYLVNHVASQRKYQKKLPPIPASASDDPSVDCVANEPARENGHISSAN